MARSARVSAVPTPEVLSPAAFAREAERLRPRLRAAAHAILRDASEAEDAVQDGLISALRALDGFRGEARLSSWLHRIVVNAALMRLRTHRRRREQLADLANDELGSRPAVWPSASRAPDEVAAERERVRHVSDAFRAQPEATQRVLRLTWIEDRSLREVASELGTTVAAVKLRGYRARRSLRRAVELLESTGGGETARRS